MTEENKNAQSLTEPTKALLTKNNIGEFFIADVTGDKDADSYKLKLKYKNAGSNEEKSTFEGFIKKTALAEDTPKENICVRLIAVEEDQYEFVLNDTVISYHTFMFPFLYATDKITRKEFGSRCHPGWRLDLWEPERMNDQLDYNQYHYFNETAHNAIYTTKSAENGKKRKSDENFENAAVINLRFDLSSLITEDRADDHDKKKADSFEYVIRKYNDRKPGEKLTVKFEYALDIHAIRMKLYNTGVGILIFELENSKYPTEKNVIRINDFGRRIYAPYYAYYNESMHCSICANEIFFNVNGKHIGDADLLPERLRASAEETVLAEPIRILLSNGDYTITTKNTYGKNDTRIETALDDRMFVACYYKNGDFVDAMREWDGENYRYLTHAKENVPFDNGENANAAHRLYTMMYADGDGLCCHSRSMMQKLLSDDHIYTRWLEYGWSSGNEKCFYGSITGFSEYTMITVAKDPPDHLIAAFLTQYVEMATLVLAQRTSLLSFEYMISEYAHGRSYNVEDIHKRYILFQSQILLNEVTSQQQGLELYDLLKQNLMIEKEQSEIKEQIEGLFEHRNYVHDKKENRILFWLSLLSIAEATDIVTNLFIPENGAWIPSVVKGGIMLALAAFIGISYKHRK
ncbi:MAG: hypothetical protein IKM00_02085 [Clostridia bacterium]|nr:hypothetical protein [Clostridia bacterium]